MEAEGFQTHGTRAGLRRDARRYTELAVWGWSVLRFTWEEVMFEPDYVRWALASWLAQRLGQVVPAPPASRRFFA